MNIIELNKAFKILCPEHFENGVRICLCSCQCGGGVGLYSERCDDWLHMSSYFDHRRKVN